MKKLIYNLFTFSVAALLFSGCYKNDTYLGGVVSPYFAIYDLRNLYKGKPVELNKNSLYGSSKIACITVSDHTNGNLPEGLLIVQNNPRLNFLRGVAINIGANAKNYLPGDSLVIDLEGAVLNKVNNILQVSNITAQKITKVSSGNPINVSRVNIDKIIARPDDYESTLLAIVKGGFTYQPTADQKMDGDQQVTDGFGLLSIKTENSSPLAAIQQHKMANYYGIIFSAPAEGKAIPYLKLRKPEDVVPLTSVYKTPKIIITGWNNDPQGTDANNEYIQFLATEDIYFTESPFSVVTTNNANASAPTGFPVNGWATGQVRTYKINITAGFAKKGTFFYVGGTNKLINSTSSTNISTANWVATYAYHTLAGQDFGTATTNLLANSGNAYGVAVFAGTTVTKESIPEDVMFCSTGGSLYGNGLGYRICNNDYYDIINPLNLEEQPFYRSGTNLTAITYNTPSDAGLFNVFGGEFNMTLGRWTKARAKITHQLTKQSTLEEIENPEIVTKLIY
ncbi:DUF5689 domain-containing protein [Polluticaenibacter yanchengensis]|uniref:DUF5689 domain-containing protein n=1 Tax=Polluticaenibacter yanchengensis TaxID=3014562 RepID=A0ABT4UL95_9BACT|nr:DUF5689 domain-containing protein [Chitinophagaceae bacterium LY-5]